MYKITSITSLQNKLEENYKALYNNDIKEDIKKSEQIKSIKLLGGNKNGNIK